MLRGSIWSKRPTLKEVEQGVAKVCLSVMAEHLDESLWLLRWDCLSNVERNYVSRAVVQSRRNRLGVKRQRNYSNHHGISRDRPCASRCFWRWRWCCCPIACCLQRFVVCWNGAGRHSCAVRHSHQFRCCWLGFSWRDSANFWAD